MTGSDGSPVDLPSWHAWDVDEVAARLAVSPTAGLSEAAARARLAEHGPNRLAEERRVTFWAVVQEEVAEPMIVLLLAIGVIYALFGEPGDAVAIFLIIAGIVLVEVYNEHRAKAAIAALHRLAQPVAPAIREGRYRDLPTYELVPGDLVLLRPGERVAADLRLVEAVGLRVDESSLTGESGPVEKIADPVPARADLADRRDLAYAGTLVTAGRGRGLVVATGMATELGRIAGLARAAREPRTPLQQAMGQLSGWLVYLAVGFSVLVPALGLLFGQPLRDMFLTGLTLAFATIPEEMPILVTVVLGLGALRLSRRHAIVKRLRAAETLGGVTIVATDKTGTITENRMAVADLWLAGESAAVPLAEAAASPGGRFLLELAVLASDAVLARVGEREAPSGDPTETALLTAARDAGLDVAGLRAGGPVAEATFDEHRRLIATAFRREDGLLVAVKGAAEAVLERCDRVLEGAAERPLDEAGRRLALERAAEMAGGGERVLAIACRRLVLTPPSAVGKGESAQAGLGSNAASGGDPACGVPPSLPGKGDRGLGLSPFDSGLAFVGLAGLADPPRLEVPAALSALQAAGIRVLLLTGDHPATARAVARAVGIAVERVLVGRDLDALDERGLSAAVDEVAVYARIAPEHKLRIVRSLQAQGEVVAVTGDGVNDAPALREAAIGIAMGETGTDAAKEAADMVLGDDSFATIVVAVEEGRKLYANLRKAVRYYLAAKVALVSASLVAVLAQLPVPFAPIQIIVMELFMDLGASVAFTTEPAEGDLMAQPPRNPRAAFMDRAMRAGIFAGGLSLCVAVSAAYLWAWSRGADVRHAQSVAFATWMVGHLALAAQMRSEREPLARLGLLSNPAFLLWAASALLLLGLALYVPALQPALRTAPLGLADWVAVLVAGLLTSSWMEVAKLLGWRAGERATISPSWR